MWLAMSATNYIDEEMCDVNETCVSDKVDFMIKHLASPISKIYQKDYNSGTNLHIFKYKFVTNVE